MTRRRISAIVAGAAAVAAVLGGATGPVGAITSPTPVTLYVTQVAQSSLVRVQSSGAVGPAVAVGQLPTDVEISEDGTTAYVAARFSDLVAVVDLATLTVEASIPVDCPLQIALVPGQPKAYATQGCGTTVTPLDLATNTAGTSIEVGPLPYDVDVASDGSTAYVTTWGAPGVTPGALTPIAVASDTVGTPVPFGGTIPTAVEITSDGGTAFVALQQGGAVVPVDLATGMTGERIPVPSRPAGLALTPDGATLYVTHEAVTPLGIGEPAPRDVTPVDLATGTALPQIAVGSATHGVVVTADGTTAFVTETGVASGVVSIDVATNTAGSLITVPGSVVGLAIGPTPPPDTTAPTIDLQTTPSAPSGGGGMWFNRQDLLPSGTLTATAVASDVGSGVASVACVVDGIPRSTSGSMLAIQGLSDGVHALSCTATDNAGNVTDPPVTATYRVDTTAPTLVPTVTGSGPGGTVLLGDHSAAASSNAADGAGSGVDTASCGTPIVGTVGPHTVSCSAADVAGNSATVAGSYLVEYLLVGLEPADGTSTRAGRPIQVRVSLADANGTLLEGCDGCVVRFQAFGVDGSGQSAGPFEMRFHAASQQYRSSWKPASSPVGQTRITVSVSYPGTTATTTKSALVTLT